MAKRQGNKKAGKQNNVSSEAQESTAVLSRVQPVGVREDGRMYYLADCGQVFTVRRLPFLAMRSILKYLADSNSSLYQFVQESAPDQDVDAVRADIEDRIPSAGAKCVRAFQRLKDRGLYASTILGLRDLMEEKLPNNLGWPMDIILDMSAGLSGMEDWDADISDDIWLSAIELSVYMLHRESYLNSAETMQWGVFVNQDFEFIWILTYLLTYGSALYLDIRDAKSEIDEAKTRVNQILDMARIIDELQSKVRSQQVEFDKKSDSRERELETLRTDNGRLSRENMKLKLKLELLESGLSESDLDSDDGFDFDAPVEDNNDSNATFTYALPETNILFVGGHVRLQNKLKQMHPKWKFVSTKMSYSLLDDNLKSKFVFFYTGHMSHKLFDKVRDSLGSVPMAYVASQNMNLLHAEMQRAYNEYYEAQGQPDF